MNIGVIGGLSALIGWGCADFVSSKLGKNINAISTLFYMQVAEVLLILPVVLLGYNESISVSWALAFPAITGVLFAFSYTVFIQSMVRGPIGIAAPIGNSYSLLTLVLSVIFLGAIFTRLQYLAIFMTLIGAVILSFEKISGRAKISKTAELAAIAASGWGVAFIFLDETVANFGWVNTILFVSAMIVCSLWVWSKLFAEEEKIISLKTLNPNSYKLLSALIVLDMAGAVGFFYSLSAGAAVAVPAVIASASPLATVFLATIVDKERLEPYRYLGVIAVILGLVGLSI